MSDDIFDEFSEGAVPRRPPVGDEFEAAEQDEAAGAGPEEAPAASTPSGPGSVAPEQIDEVRTAELADPPEPSWRKPAEVLRAVPRPQARFATGLPALDSASRGGLPTGSLVVVQGGPDSGKTGLVIQIAVRIGLENDIPVWIYTSDGGAEATAIRVGLLLGLDGERLDQRDAEEIEKLEQAFAERRIFVVSDSADEMTLQRLIVEAETVDPAVPHVLAVDSVQETPPGWTASTQERDTVNANIRNLRRAKASTVPWLLLATSEVIKSSYAGRGSNQTTPLAAGSESSKIGYAASLVLHLVGDPGKAPDFCRVLIPKNKLGGGKRGFSLRLETPSLRLLELDAPAAAAERQERERVEEDGRLREFAEKLWRLLYDEGPKNGREIVEALHCHERRVAEAIALLGPRIGSVPGPKNSKIHTALGQPPEVPR